MIQSCKGKQYISPLYQFTYKEFDTIFFLVDIIDFNELYLKLLHIDFYLPEII